MKRTKSPLEGFLTIKQYSKLAEKLLEIPDSPDKRQKIRYLARTDLYFLLTFVLGKTHVIDQWLLDRCKEVEKDPDFHLDLWARGHFKSTIITFGKTIQDIIASHGTDPLEEWQREVTVCIFSSTRPLAKSFLRTIKEEFESNAYLINLFSDVFYQNPKIQSPKWSEDEGITVKRNNNVKEATVEAWGLIDGQPIGKHYLLRIYDDIVTDATVTTSEMQLKVTEKYQLSNNLGTENDIVRIIGTRYHFNDTYQWMIDNNLFHIRKYPCLDESGNPVLLKLETIQRKIEEQGSYIFNCQMMLNPVADARITFKMQDIQLADFNYEKRKANYYILVDPAGTKSNTSDYTSIITIAAASDKNYYIVDMIRDKLSLKERVHCLFEVVQKFFHYGNIFVGYETYGMQCDIEYIKEMQDTESFHFSIQAVGGSLSKKARIERLLPDFQNKKVFLPHSMIKINYEKKQVDLVQVFLKEEYLQFPVCSHDDMLDALARIKDMSVSFPFESVYTKDDESLLVDSCSPTGY